VDTIVQDGGSTDGSADILLRYAPRLKHWASEKDHGQADALRRGFLRTEGGPDDIMAYLNSDDLFMPGALRFVAEHFARNPKVDVVYGHRVLIDERGNEVGRWLVPRRSCDDLRLFDLIPQETLFWRRRIYERAGGIDPSFGFAVDWDLLLRFAAAGARFERLPWFLGLFRLHPAQKSQALLEKVGIPEMDALRERNLGRAPARSELVAGMERAQLDSAVVAAWMRRGWRL
jgi:glycosyltransferase involved in cell wall biosynthesis